MIYNIKFSWQLSWHLREILHSESPLPLNLNYDLCDSFCLYIVTIKHVMHYLVLSIKMNRSLSKYIFDNDFVHLHF